ncbi:MAG: hypothetical protein RLZZ502_569 [Pseudomonadota bacterium]
MIGIVIIAHTPLASALLSAATHVLGAAPAQCLALDIGPHCCPAEDLDSFLQQLHSVDQGEGILVLTDMYGASPANLTSKLVAKGAVRAVAGVNLAMLVRACTSRSQGMEYLLRRVVGGACDSIFEIELDTSETGSCRISQALAGQMKVAA